MKYIHILLLSVVLSVLSLPVVAQDMKVTGVVRDAWGEPVAGASISLKGARVARAITDLNGQFTIEGLSRNDVLVFSYIGMQKTEVKARPQMTVVMNDDEALMQELLVTAFGQQTRESFTGSAAVVKSEDLLKKQSTNVLGAIQGEVAGVQMTNNSGDPTAEPDIRIRGFSSINAANDPLIILDGAPYDGGFNSINPADVASVTVLKDAASNALYGARGANGVILITTKSPARGDNKTTITFDAKWGANKEATVDYDYISNPGAYYEMYYKALHNYYLNSGQSSYEAHTNANENLGAGATECGLGYMAFTVPNGEMLIGENGRMNPNARLGNRVYNNGRYYTILPDKWVDAAYRTALRQEYNVNVSTSTDKARLYVSLGYLNNEGVAVNTDYTRYTARLKGDWQAKPWLSLSGNVGYTHNESTAITTDSDEKDDTYNLFYSLRRMAPIYPLYVRDGNGNIMRDGNGLVYDYGDATHHGLNRPELGQTNLIQESMLNTNKSIDNQMTFNGAIDITPLEGLKVTLNGTVATSDYKNTNTINPFYGSGASMFDKKGYVGATAGNTLSLNFQQLIAYNFSFGNNNFNLLAGHENYKYTSDYIYGSKVNMVSYYEDQTLAGAIKLYGTGETTSEYSNEGWFFRGMYDYDERYFASFSYRRDASSRFHPDHRWGDFYSAGLAWIMSKEKWLGGVSWIDMLKLKASVGQQGNDKIGDYRYTDLYTIVNNAGELGLQLSSKGNPNITWETNTNFNAGVEFELFKGRLSGSVEYFFRRTTDMLFFLNAPKSAGYAGNYDNIGDMDNSGIEIDLSGTIIKKRNFVWKVNLNATHFTNEIVRLAEPIKNTKIANYGDHKGRTGSYSGQYLFEGQSIYTWCVPKYAGVDNDGLSQWYLKDGTKTTDYSKASKAENLFLCGEAIPDLYGGFGTKLSAYGVDLSITFNYSIGGLGYDYGYAQMMSNPTSTATGYNIHKDMYNAWSTTNPNSNIPRWMYGDNNTGSMSSRFLTDASYLTLQNINLGYTLPNKWTKKVGLSSIRLYMAADNICYWSKRKGFDPRGSFSGAVRGNNYSPVRSISGGITITL